MHTHTHLKYLFPLPFYPDSSLSQNPLQSSFSSSQLLAMQICSRNLLGVSVEKTPHRPGAITIWFSLLQRVRWEPHLTPEKTAVISLPLLHPWQFGWSATTCKEHVEITLHKDAANYFTLSIWAAVQCFLRALRKLAPSKKRLIKNIQKHMTNTSLLLD